MKHVGFIGLGIMGKPMALNLLKAKFPLTVYARRPEVTIPLRQAGAEVAPSIKRLAETCDVIITMVSETQDVENIILGKGGILENTAQDSIIVDMSTISPSATRRIAETLAQREIHMLDAPVSGGEQGAKDGTLSIMVGGDSAILERVLPLLNAMGKKIVHIGPHGTGQVAKACNQIIIAETLVAITEGFQLAVAAGADLAKVREALLSGFAASRVLEVHGKRLLENNFEPGFKAKLHHSDLALALEEAGRHGLVLPGAAFAVQLFSGLTPEENENKDSTIIANVLKRLNPQVQLTDVIS